MTHDIDINTRIEIANETATSTNSNGQAGKVAIVGSFPNYDDGVYSFTTLRSLRNYYGITVDTASEKNFDGARSAKRIFMDGISGYKGATEVITVNIRNSEDAEAAGATTEGTLTVNTVTGDEADSSTYDDDVTSEVGTTLTMQKLVNSLTKLSGENMDLLYISSDLNDIVGEEYETTNSDGETVTDEYTITDVIDRILQFIDEEFTTQRPTNLILPIKCTENISEGQDTAGLTSSIINVDDACAIAQQFAEDINNITTIGLYYQGGTINGYDVDVVELAAHMTGFTASLQVSQSLTYQEIPGLTAVNEEVFFGEHDAGRILNEAGVMVIVPKSRKDNTYCVKNDTQGNGWNINHIRSVSYLLKQYDLVSGLGINNFETNLEAFKAQLTATNNTVLQSVDVIRDITLGDIEVLTPYKIYVPVEITLAGVISIIRLGVNMSLEDTGSE